MATSNPESAGVNRSQARKSNARARLMTLFAISLATAVVGVCAVDSADAETPERRHIEVLELKLQNDQYASTDLGPAGPSLGDMNVYSGTAIRDGRRAGRGGGTCQVVHIDGEGITTQCLISIELERGSLTMQSLMVSGRSSLDMAITGGTGVYNNARGTVRYWDIATSKERLRAEILR
ncbi:hypothetical protein ACH4FX_42525 [Streptomyces sp. NPDC018019]|uniref:allene oxide cyclase barrel-like domain-containing protein n=1 Tax=Streptomyces sp. NPDC018019 TaxID=3365030 RepID=UPI0037ADBCAB